MKILVLDAVNKNTLAIVRHLGREKKYEIHTVYHSKLSISIYSGYIKRSHKLSNPANSGKYKHDLIELLKQEKFDLVIPVGFSTYKICAEIRDEIKKYSDVIVTTSENIDSTISKAKTYSIAEEVKIPYPKTFVAQTLNDLGKIKIKFPLVIKGPFEAGNNIVKYADNENELKVEWKKMVEKYGFTSPDMPLIQEYIRGRGYGFFAYYDEGKLKRYFMHKRLREDPATGGASTCAESFRDEKLFEHGKKILDHLNWNGVAMVEFKKGDDDGEYKLMEINPKFWGSLDLSLCAGVNFPYYLIQRHLKEEVAYSDDYNDIRFQWLLNGELFHFFQRPLSLFAITGDLFISKNDIWLRDIKPNIFQLLLILVRFYKLFKK
ncbi:MAG: ATP-grasp domain-containing protein [Ignavibacteria bacterium]